MNITALPPVPARLGNEDQMKIIALYERLSHDDEMQGESNSIVNQKRLLEEYAAQHGFVNTVHFTDDGISGARFDRPGLTAMMDEVEAGRVSVVLIKDMSRLGRDYLRVGLLMETLRENGVRLLAINEGVDSFREDDDFTPFRNIINEFYLKDCSRKIKSVFKAKGLSGKHTSSTTPYGYLKSESDKNQWVVDEEAAAVVRRIFRLTLEGHGPYQICCILSAEKVEKPGYYLAQKGAGLHQSRVFIDPYNWSSSTVCGILKKKEYLGHTVNFKTRKHFKDKKSKYVPEDEWLIFENTHEAIIDQETFDTVQRIRSNVKRRPDGWGYVHPLTGLLFCADCGGKLYVHRTSNGKDIPKYVCGNYGKVSVGSLCASAHRIDADTVMQLVKETLRDIAAYAQKDSRAFEQAVQAALSAQQTGEVKAQRKRLAACTKRVADLEVLIRRVYEDHALGKLPLKRYEALSSEYEREQSALEAEMAQLQTSVDAYSGGTERARKFTALVKRYTGFDELTTAMLNEFVEKIVIHERDRKGCIDTTQQVDIYLSFIGQFQAPQPEIDPAVQAALDEERRKKLERQERLHQNYLRRKATGKQQEYDRRYNEKRKAKREAEKAAAMEDANQQAAAYAV